MPHGLVPHSNPRRQAPGARQKVHAVRCSQVGAIAGHVPDAVLGAYFEVASLFVCLSEHEGFGAPVLEAMSFNVPVVALNATGVAMTMGDAGILVNQPRPDAISEIADVLAQDDELRQRVIVKQRARLSAYTLDAAHTADLHRDSRPG